MPSILTEIGYLTNPLEETFLGSEQGQDYLAKAIFRGVRKYKDEVDGTKREYNDAFENQPALENENLKAGNQPYVKRSDEDETDEDEKKPDEITNLKSVSETTVNGNKAPEIVKKSQLTIADTVVKSSENSDTTVNASKIVEKFKTTKPGGQDVKTTLKNEPVKPAEPVKLIENKQAVVFKVQFASSETALDLGLEKYKALSNPEFYKSGTTFKYTSGSFSKFKTAQMHQNVLKSKGFNDCFVIAFKNGTRIDLNAARQETGQ